ncbi:MAG: hypothetical protein ACI351_01725 [Candidatus Avelusimicrobium sp.]|uniref:hypothetical protein n=1 Tax=Candidatus Avelusimicrobium sp. TaxID=3048833 RepID=UPI003F0BBC35
MEYFTGDKSEKKIVSCAGSLFQILEGEVRAFFQNAYNAEGLGRVLYDAGLAPLSNILPRDTFAGTMNALFEKFRTAGTFESYISVFKTIFGADTGVVFEVLGKAQLRINITAKRAGTRLWGTLDEKLVKDKAGKVFAFQRTVKSGDYYEARQVLTILTPGGIYLEVTFKSE